MRPKVLVTRAIPDAGIQLLEEHCQVTVRNDPAPPSKEELLRQVGHYDGLLCLLTDPVDGEVLEAGKRLRVVSNYAVGYDNIAVEDATRLGIPVGNTPGVLTETTADLAFALLCTGARRIIEGRDFAAQGKWKTWEPNLLLGADIHGATLGIVGMGRIGRAVAARAAGFSMKIIYSDPAVNPDELPDGVEPASVEELFAQSDFVSLHALLNEKTRHMVNASTLSMMKKTAILVNTARGGLVDSNALAQALRTGKPAFAALDVTDPEPLATSHELYRLENCLIVPHIGSASVATRMKMSLMAAENILAGLEAKPLPHPVNPEVYER